MVTVKHNGDKASVIIPKKKLINVKNTDETSQAVTDEILSMKIETRFMSSKLHIMRMDKIILTQLKEVSRNINKISNKKCLVSKVKENKSSYLKILKP